MTADAAIGHVVNVGTSFEVSIGDTAREIADLMNVEITITSDDQRIRPAHSEVERLVAANEQARILLNWIPSYGGIEGFRRGLRETIEWFSDPNNLRQYKSDVYNK
jgi:nucleoside-diphosphate-sugar epimerase